MGSGRARTWRWALVPAAALYLGAVPLAPPAVASTAAVARAGTVVAALSTSSYGPVLIEGGKLGVDPLAGWPLYEFSGDAAGKFGCTTRRAQGFDFDDLAPEPLTCTGPESDAINEVATDDWPALTTTGTPVAGPGADPKLLGSVDRPGIGRQVTYGGHPLYLFDPASSPFDPQGEAFAETGAPMAPWHGLWYLVSARGGQPASGPATIETGTLPSGRTVVAVPVFPNVGPVADTVYSFSRDAAGTSVCTGACAVMWVPVLTTGKPHAGKGIAANAVGVVHRPGGTDQVTYDGKPLYLYSAERFVISAGGPPDAGGTVGNGNGLPGPGGGTFSVIYPG